MANSANKEIREAAKSKKIHLWQVAEGIGVSEFYFSRRLRRELPQQEKESILNLIDNLAAEGARNVIAPSSPNDDGGWIPVSRQLPATAARNGLSSQTATIPALPMPGVNTDMPPGRQRLRRSKRNGKSTSRFQPGGLDIEEVQTMANEKRLVDANELLNANMYGNTAPITHRTYAENLIQKAPTVDAVEVVRCKDCKWRNTKACPFMLFLAVPRGDFDFCSDGEKEKTMTCPNCGAKMDGGNEDVV